MGSAHNTGMQIEDIVHKQIEELALKWRLACWPNFSLTSMQSIGYVLPMLKVFKHWVIEAIARSVYQSLISTNPNLCYVTQQVIIIGPISSLAHAQPSNLGKHLTLGKHFPLLHYNQWYLCGGTYIPRDMCGGNPNLGGNTYPCNSGSRKMRWVVLLWAWLPHPQSPLHVVSCMKWRGD